MWRIPSGRDMAKSPSPNDQQSSREEAWILNARNFIEKYRLREVPEAALRKGAFDEIVILNGMLKVDRIERGRITCVFPVKPQLTNDYNTLHGGVIASITEAMALGCARSVAGDKDFFLGELAMTYLSAAPVNAEVEVDSCITKHGRNVIVASVEFRMKQTRKLLYNGRATFYNMPVASL